MWAISSVVERVTDNDEVGGSIPPSPTQQPNSSACPDAQVVGEPTLQASAWYLPAGRQGTRH